MKKRLTPADIWKKHINRDVLDEFEIDLENINQDALRTISSKVYVNEYLVKYEYLTKRKNKKERLIKIKAIDKDEAAKQIFTSINLKNIASPVRAISNVKILGIKTLAEDLEVTV